VEDVSDGSGATHEVGTPDDRIPVLGFEEHALTPRAKNLYTRYLDQWSLLVPASVAEAYRLNNLKTKIRPFLVSSIRSFIPTQLV
jgi:hypothetical protein